MSSPIDVILEERAEQRTQRPLTVEDAAAWARVAEAALSLPNVLSATPIVNDNGIIVGGEFILSWDEYMTYNLRSHFPHVWHSQDFPEDTAQAIAQLAPAPDQA